MLKDNRQGQILQLIQERGFLKVSEASELLDVAEMTIRRDLTELEQEGQIEKVHGGAKKSEEKTPNPYTELSHKQKKILNIDNKQYIAKQAAELIEDNDTIFIGPGTTTEYIYDYIHVNSAKIVTNSISIFNRFRDNPKFDLILIGGKLREKTGTFIGHFTRKWIQGIKVQKVFIGTNGIKDEHITTAEEEEGVVQGIILENSDQNYILADSNKFGVEAFQVLCPIDNVTAIITDRDLSHSFETYYQDKCKIMK